MRLKPDNHSPHRDASRTFQNFSAHASGKDAAPFCAHAFLELGEQNLSEGLGWLNERILRRISVLCWVEESQLKARCLEAGIPLAPAAAAVRHVIEQLCHLVVGARSYFRLKVRSIRIGIASRLIKPTTATEQCR